MAMSPSGSFYTERNVATSDNASLRVNSPVDQQPFLINAARSSPVYGNSTTTQPKIFYVLTIIKV